MTKIFVRALGGIIALGLASASLTAQATLGTEVQSLLEGKTISEPKYKKELKLAEEHYLYLTKQANYSRSFGTRIYPSSGLFARSVPMLKSAFLYSLQSQKFTHVAQHIQAGDLMSLMSVGAYTIAGINEPKLNKQDLLEGWVAVHYYAVKNQAGEEEKKMMLFFLEPKGNKLELVDAGEWFGYEHEQVEAAMKHYWGDYHKELERILGGERIDTTPITEEPDSVASFVGGQPALMEYLGKTIEYPETAAEFGVSGRVIVEFVVEADGSISSVFIRSSVENSLDLEALRVVLAMPKWTPAQKGGAPIRGKMSLPLVFRTELPAEDTKK